MAQTEHATGSQTAVIGTEHTLNPTTPDTTTGMFQVFVDLANMVAGDLVEIRIKRKVVSAGTIRQVLLAAKGGAQSDPGWASPALLLRHGWDVTLKQTAGTGRVFPWSIEKVA